jgi:CDP-6-deoxy-D-xylo-4-hexulose-3-dehydrase
MFSDTVNHIANKYDLFVFEDTAQAHGSKYKGKNTGNLSLLADYSFYIAHNIQVGEMGAIVTNDEKLYKKLISLRNHGIDKECRERFGPTSSWSYDMKLL